MLFAACCIISAALPAGLQAAPAPAPAQKEAAGQPVFRVETSLALARFHVVRKKKYVDDLRPGDIEILEDGVPQKVAFFEGGKGAPRTVPVELLLLFDTSLSVMNSGLLDAFVFKQNVLDGLPYASLSVYAFHNRLKRFAAPTRDLEALRRAFRGVEGYGRGGTRLYEAVMQTAKDASSGAANATRLMLIFSDGFPTTDTKPEAAARVARYFGIPLYPVALGHHRLVEQARNLQQRAVNARGMPNPNAMDRLQRLQAKEREILEFAQLGEMTGGRSYDPRDVNSDVIRRILAALVEQVQAEYVAGYYPGPSSGPRRPRKVEVRLRAAQTGKIYGGTRVLVR